MPNEHAQPHSTPTLNGEHLIQPDAYEAEFAEKSKRLADKLAPFFTAPLDCFPSKTRHYRMRAEFKIWQEGQKAHYAMFSPEDKSRFLLEQFPVANETINAAMPLLLELANKNELLRKRWFQCEFLSTQQNTLLITLIYHKPLCDAWQAAAQTLQTELRQGLAEHNVHNVWLIGRSRGQKMVLEQDFVTETLAVGEREFHYRQLEGGFTQPNAGVCESMLSWAVNHAQALNHEQSGDLLELYCGNGNFTLPLAQHFNKVLATEISKTSIQAAQHNVTMNGFNNIEFIRLSSEECTQALDGVRSFRRLSHIDLNDYQFSTVFVDPPRAGLDDATLAMIARFDHIIYISCNPDTLIANLQQLTQTHHVERAAFFDQFPYTHHMEAGVILKKCA